MPAPILLSASNLADHLACRHKTGLDLAVKRGEIEAPVRHDPALERLIERGLAHERAYIEHLRAAGLEVEDLSELRGEENHARVREAASRGVDVIVQANLRGGRFQGYADVLVKVDRQGDLGDWSYEVVDTKLAQETRGGTVLQLCLYADLLGAVQGEPAARMHVVKPGEGFPRESFRFADHHAYYRLVRARLEAAVDDEPEEVYPRPVDHCSVCPWWRRCDERRHADDHLSLVAGMTGAHAAELERQGVLTLETFATEPEPLREAPRRGRIDAFARLQDQAEVQLRGRHAGENVCELLAHEPGRGLSRLPAPSPGDVFLDFEGDRHVEDGGLEYLTGYAWRDESGERWYCGLWATTRAQEKRAFEEFVDLLVRRRAETPDFHVYHYAPYEPSALRRLAMRHATREDELDVLLREERFVDLYAITRQGVRASVESYSLKPLEAFFGYEREIDLREEASPALRRVECALEQGVPDEINADDRARVEGYNRDDCLSLIELQAWLETKRAELLATGENFDRPPPRDGEESEQAAERSEELRAIFDRLVEGLPEDEERTEEDSARWLLAHLLEYFHREDKVAWWEYFARRDMEIDELLQERKALVHLEFVEDLGPPTPKAKLPVHRYSFPPQEASFSEGDDIHDLFAELEDKHRKLGKVHAFDAARGLVDVKKTGHAKEHHPAHLHVHDRVPPKPLDGSLIEFARWVAEHGVDADDPKLRAGRDLLLRRPPRTRNGRAPLAPEGSDSITAALGVARDLDGGVLAIQGPPGAGKTYTGARTILGLAREGHRVGIAATSHKVIRNLLEGTLKAAREEGVDLEVAHKPSSRSSGSGAPLPDGYEHVNTDGALAALDDGKVVGGVAWLWAASDCEESLDFLFLDEAGQMSLAQVLACARATKNLILLGDPRQLQQPQRGAHPEGSEISALDHLLGEHATMPADLGLFLAETWRLPPAICAYTSEVFYEDRLRSRPHCAGQVLSGPTPFAGNGLFLVHAEHENDQSVSPTEVEVVRRAVDALLRPGVSWTDGDGKTHDMTPDDLLVIAPYNAQVAALQEALPHVAVGTVDRFQGQERPVVLYSMTSSTAQDAPRGMAFLYDPHRLNVATSRAQCVCILIGTRALFEPECRTPEQIRWANGICRYGELAIPIELS